MGNAKTLARRLLKQNRGTRSIPARSWREIADQDYNGKIPRGTLCRFAINDGKWLPSIEHQITLGLRRERKPKVKAVMPLTRQINEMAVNTMRALRSFKSSARMQ